MDNILKNLNKYCCQNAFVSLLFFSCGKYFRWSSDSRVRMDGQSWL